MEHLPCYLWATFVVAAIPCLIAWCIRPRHRRFHGYARPTACHDEAHAPAILWLTPACAAALRNCSEPAVLARASARKIAAMLEQAHFPPGEKMPDSRHYETWPEQAAMLAAGRYEALRAWQQRWTGQEKPTTEAFANEEGNMGLIDERAEPGSDGWLVATLLLLAAALLSALFLRPAICAASSTPPTAGKASVPPAEAPRTMRLTLNTDGIFDYNMAGAYYAPTLEHRLRALFSGFEGIQIISVEGHTDPIGSAAGNRELGRKRAEAVLQAVRDMVGSAKGAQFVRAPLPSAPASVDPVGVDIEPWHYCFQRFQRAVAPHFRPLRDLDPGRNPEQRPSCQRATVETDAGTAFPACTGPYDANVGPHEKVYARQAENFRELTACLSPMRHVVVTISYMRQVPPSP